MKRIILISAMLLMVIGTFAHNRSNEPGILVADTIYYGPDRTLVHHASQAAYYRLLMCKGNGVAKKEYFEDHYMNGNLKAIGGYSFIDLGNDNNSVFHGDITTFYDNGQQKLHGKYIDGKRDGYFTLQMKDGSVAVIIYQDGKSKYDYFMITRNDGTQEKHPLAEIKTLL